MNWIDMNWIESQPKWKRKIWFPIKYHVGNLWFFIRSLRPTMLLHKYRVRRDILRFTIDRALLSFEYSVMGGCGNDEYDRSCQRGFRVYDHHLLSLGHVYVVAVVHGRIERITTIEESEKEINEHDEFRAKYGAKEAGAQ